MSFLLLGNEPDPSRTDAPGSALVVVTAGCETNHLIRT
ncbi:unnamed protein product, partial [marine sediment metagenome]